MSNNDFINSKIQLIYAKFNDCVKKGYVIQRYPLNYNCECSQLNYLLKYYYAYYCLWIHIASNYIDEFKSSSILSIGAGAGIDNDVLNNINKVKYYNSLNLEHEYVGVDLNEWVFREDNPNSIFINSCISKIDKTYIRDSNVYTFPHSLGDIGKNKNGKDILEQLAFDIVKYSKFDEITFVVSLTNRKEFDNFAFISDVLENNDYELYYYNRDYMEFVGDESIVEFNDCEFEGIKSDYECQDVNYPDPIYNDVCGTIKPMMQKRFWKYAIIRCYRYSS